MHVVPVDEGHGDTGLSRTAGTTGAVQVGVVVFGDRVVDHVGDIVHVDSAGGNVGGNQDVLFAGLERSHGALTLLLVEVTVHGGGVEATVVEFFDELRSGALGAGEDHGFAAALGLEDARDDLILVEAVRAVDHVLDVRLRQALVGVRRADVDGLVHKATSKGHDRAGHRCREQHGVTGGRSLREQLLDVGEEPEVEHLVGLVENHHLDVFERQHALAGEVEEAAGGTNNNLCAVFQVSDLSLVRLSAVNRDNLGCTVRCGEGEVFSDLHTQLAGGHNNQRLHTGLGVEAEFLQ